ncbi:MAG: AmmeMemoRadiSam system protein B [Planctomycetota bacterium]|jgi:AmmeMemoRadiSam system protein B
MSIRSAEKAGTWYSSNPDQLKADLKSYLNYDNLQHEGRVIAGIVPHAGLSFSGPTAGKVYNLLSMSNPELIIVFGAVHTMHLSSPAVWQSGSWETPLGDVTVNSDFSTLICEKGIVNADDTPHYGDNAIELQMPFIKYCFPEAEIVPIAVPPAKNIEILGSEIFNIVKDNSLNAITVGSTDFTHYGDNFGFTPAGYGDEALNWTRNNDKNLIDLIINYKLENIVETAHKCRSACGAGAIAATAGFAKEADATAKLLEYTNSYEVRPEGIASHFVGYAGIIFSTDGQ